MGYEYVDNDTQDAEFTEVTPEEKAAAAMAETEAKINSKK